MDGLAAVDFLKAHRVDLTVLDLFLPSMDGWAVLEQMKCLPRRPPVVVVSGVSDVNVTPRVFREGVEAFIAKPFQLGTLINTCAELIARAKGRAPTVERRQRGARRTLTLPVTVRDGDDRLLHAGRLLNLSVLGGADRAARAVVARPARAGGLLRGRGRPAHARRVRAVVATPGPVVAGNQRRDLLHRRLGRAAAADQADRRAEVRGRKAR